MIMLTASTSGVFQGRGHLGKSYHHGDLRQALLDATLGMIRDDEVQLIGFRELARRLDVSRTAPYRHFESVEQLLAVVVEEGFQKFVAALERVTGDASIRGQRRLIELGVAYVHFALENSAHYRLMFDPRFFEKGRFPAIQALSARAFGLLKETAAVCLPQGASKAEKAHMANLAWAAVHGMARLFIDGQWNHVKNRPRFIRESCEKFLAQLGIGT